MKPIRLHSRTKKKMQKTNGKNRMPAFAGGRSHHAGDELVGHLGHRLHAAGHAGASPGADRDQEAGEGDRQQHIQPGIGQRDVMMGDGNLHDRMNGELLDRIDRRSRLGRHVV